MTITTNDDRDEYTASSGQTVFNYTFKIYESSDLNVYQTPAGQDFDDGTDITTAYTVSGVGDAAGGTITLNTGATVGDRITIVSAIPSSRSTDYQTNGDFLPSVVNDDFDRAVSLAKQAEGLARRSPKFDESRQAVSNFSLPKPIANTFWRVNGAATGLESFTATGAAVTAEVPVAGYVELRALTSASYADGQVINITNDGIAGQFVVKTGTVTDNGGTLIVFTDDSNRYCERIYDGAAYVKWFGATGDGVTDDASDIQAAIDHIESINGGALYFGTGTYRCNSGLTVTNQGITFIGESRINTIIEINADTTGITLSAARFVGKNFKLQSTQNGVGTSTSYGFYGSGSRPYVSFEDVEIQDFPGHGFYFDETFVCQFKNCISAENGGKGFVVDDGTSISITSCYARANLSGGYSFTNIAYMSGSALAADDNTGTAYLFTECFGGFIGGMGLEKNAVSTDTSLVKFVGCINFTVNGIYLTQNTGGGPSDGKSKIEVLDGTTYNTSGMRIQGVRIQTNGSPGIQYSYNINCTTNGSVYLLDAEDSGTINNSAGLADVKAGTYDFWSTSAGGARTALFDLNNQSFLFGTGAVSNGSVDASAGIGTEVGALLRHRRDTAVGATIAALYGSVSTGGENRFIDDGSAINTTGTWGTISDGRLKENISYLTEQQKNDQVEDIKALNFAKFNMIGNKTKMLGLIAQDVKKRCPGLVSKSYEDGTLSIKQSILHQKAVVALQVALDRIEALEARVKELENG